MALRTPFFKAGWLEMGIALGMTALNSTLVLAFSVTLGQSTVSITMGGSLFSGLPPSGSSPNIGGVAG